MILLNKEGQCVERVSCRFGAKGIKVRSRFETLFLLYLCFPVSYRAHTIPFESSLAPLAFRTPCRIPNAIALEVQVNMCLSFDLSFSSCFFTRLRQPL